MEEEKVGVAASVRASASFPPPAATAAPPATSVTAAAAAAASSSSLPPPMEAAAKASTSQRQRFTVELKPGETTMVSWRRLVRDSDKGNGSPPAPTGAHPALESRIAPAPAVQPVEGELNDAQPAPTRFSAVIEKIERLYMGKESSDEEELNDIPDDDQYDTEDSFIDDAELNEYFQVDKSLTKHNGFFVNRGTLERINEPSSSPNLALRKRRRKDSTKNYSGKDGEHMPNEPVNMGNVRMKAAARSAPLMGKKSSSPSRSPIPLGEHYQEGKILKNKLNTTTGVSRKKSSDFTTRAENISSLKMPNKDALEPPLERKDPYKQKVGLIQSRDSANKSRAAGESFEEVHLSSHDKGASLQVESQSRKLNDENEIEVSTKIRRREKNGITELPDLNSPGSIYPVQVVKPSTWMKDGSVRPKGTTLERAIRDLEKIVAECRPPNLKVQEADTSSQGGKKRLPPEIKQKLAKVARLAASQGKVTEKELLGRLMGILGHVVQRRTLKRNLKEMVELGLSAKQLKADRFQQIKNEVTEMIRSRVASLKSKVSQQQDGSSDDFQEVLSNEERRALKAKCSIDDAIEDKICDLYDLYVEGMDEDKGPQMRKLYVELAELWPNGYMDNYGIKDAVSRAKERKRALYRQQKIQEERIKRKKASSTVRMENTASLSSQARSAQDRPALDSMGQVLSSEKLTSNQPLSTSGRMPESTSSLNGSSHHHGSKHHEKLRVGSGSSTDPDEGIKTDAAGLKKKMKRKTESEFGETQVYPVKLPSQPGKEKYKFQKHSTDSSLSHHHKLNLQSSGVPGSEQPS